MIPEKQGLQYGCMHCYESMEVQLNNYLDNLNHMFFKSRLILFVFSILTYLFLEFYDKKIIKALAETPEDTVKFKFMVYGLRGLAIGCFGIIIITQFMSMEFNKSLDKENFSGFNEQFINVAVNDSVFNISGFGV